MSDTANRAAIRRLPIWSGPIEIAPLSGGLSNANFVVEDAGRRRVVRLGADLPFHHVFRDRETAVARAAHAAGLSPAVLHAEPGITVFEFVECTACTAADVAANWAEIVPLIRRCHGEVARHLVGPAPIFWVFHVIRDYAATLSAAGHRLVRELPRYLAVSDLLEAAQVPLPIVFGHHDLLPANILRGADRYWLVDWEYGGFGTPLFDLANLAGNAGFGRDAEIALLGAYFGDDLDPALLKAFDAMKAASLLREAMWSMVSEIHLDAPGADYVAYTAENLARFERALGQFEETIR
ncbi:choline/ethanolamine kinase family protein [Methylobrevis albus]|uniref:Phosphotransferase n=1 Tax=Methylobrevis albus TaxID=2793297 RepID=A0A931I1R4_9HYPH|nr:choline/ethanolamine kinase family protein [Methylobrevis albus]MBH0237661.1 phosphotransferase [Methylobrevis albus]